MDVPVQYFQSVIALETAITGVLLFQIRFFATSEDAPPESDAFLVTVGVAVSLLPILLRVLPPLRRDARTRQRHPHYWVTVLGLLLYAVIVLLIIAHP